MIEVMKQHHSTLIVRSADPVANHWLEASNAIDRTQPRCPLTTADSSQDGCHWGFGIDIREFFFPGRFIKAFERVLILTGCVEEINSVEVLFAYIYHHHYLHTNTIKLHLPC